MEQVKTAVIGIGNMGTAHAVCLAESRIEGAVLTAVCDIRPERLADFHARYPKVACYSSEDELLASGAAQAAVIAVPHPLHSEMAIKALNAGWHVLVEKPVDVRLSRARALCETAKKSGRVFALMAQSADESVVSESEGDCPRRTARCAQAVGLDCDQLVSNAALLRFRRMARDVGG